VPKITNNLRVDLYSKLLPRIIEEDQATGVHSYVNYWDDPDFHWDDGSLWDELGLVPVLQQIFYALETEEGKDLAEIDGLRDLVDPDSCPEEFLGYMARSMGHPLEDSISESAKRETIKSIVTLNKARGTPLSWEVFYRMQGMSVKATPLHKKSIYEANNEYSKDRYTFSHISGETIGTSGALFYEGTFANTPILPGSIRIAANGKIIRDDSNPLSTTYGNFLGPDVLSGSISYATGRYRIEFRSATTTNIIAEYDHITAEFPYKAARVDLEVFYVLGDETFDGFDTSDYDRILARLEEVRPIHVLVRLFIVVLDIPEELENFASDDVKYPQMAKDVRETEYRFYAADKAAGVEDNGLCIDTGSALTCKHEDGADFALVPDVLTIQYGTTTEHW